MQGNETVLRKKKAADEFCAEIGFVYEMVDSVPLDILKLNELIESGQVVLIDRYLQRFHKRLEQRLRDVRQTEA
jgi:hypothetical protein